MPPSSIPPSARYFVAVEVTVATICSDGLDLGLVREHPKPFIAHSDMTCMQTWLLDQLGLMSFHGPMVAGDFSAAGGSR